MGQEIKALKDRIKIPQNHRHQIEGEEGKASVINNKKDAEIAEVEREIETCETNISELNDQIYNIVKESEKIADSAAAAYPLINKSDWRNVDLVIYYFETGRADGVKEALQLVDKQRQTEQISTVIAMATQSICQTVKVTVGTLGKMMESSFDRLSEHIAQYSAGMDMSFRKYSDDRLKSDQMTRALLQKIEVSSDKLSNQIDRQMREVYNLA